MKNQLIENLLKEIKAYPAKDTFKLLSTKGVIEDSGRGSFALVKTNKSKMELIIKNNWFDSDDSYPPKGYSGNEHTYKVIDSFANIFKQRFIKYHIHPQQTYISIGSEHDSMVSFIFNEPKEGLITIKCEE